VHKKLKILSNAKQNIHLLLLRLSSCNWKEWVWEVTQKILAEELSREGQAEEEGI
jgi:hypothetical protein